MKENLQQQEYRELQPEDPVRVPPLRDGWRNHTCSPDQCSWRIEKGDLSHQEIPGTERDILVARAGSADFEKRPRVTPLPHDIRPRDQECNERAKIWPR